MYSVHVTGLSLQACRDGSYLKFALLHRQESWSMVFCVAFFFLFFFNQLHQGIQKSLCSRCSIKYTLMYLTFLVKQIDF